MRSLVGLLLLVLGAPDPILASSSPISPGESSSIAAEAGEGAPGKEARAGKPAPAGEENAAHGPSVAPTVEVPPAGFADIRSAIESGSYEKALKLLQRRVAGADPDTKAELRLLEARVLERLGQCPGAIQTYRSILDHPRLGATARAELHALYVRRGRFAAADRLTGPAARAGGGADPALTRLRAYSRSVQGEYSEAARLVAAASLAGDPEARVLRANALLALGDRDGAEELYLRVLREPAGREVRKVAHYGLGQVARLRGGRAVRALQDERAARLGPAPWAELDWGNALRALGRRPEARERLEAVVSAYPEIRSTARLALARLDEEEGRVGESLEHLVAALEGSTGDFLALTRLGELLLQEGWEEDGIHAYRAALLLFPQFPPGREGLTRALTSRGRWDEAPPGGEETDAWELPAWTWSRLLEGDLPFFPVVTDRDSIPRGDPRRVALALVHLRAGHGAAALAWTEGVSVSNGLLASIRAEALEKVGRTDDARSLWEEILQEGPGGPVALERLAVLLRSEAPDRARGLWQSLFDDYPEFPRARVRMARALEESGELGEALEAYRGAQGAGWLSPGERRRIRVAIEDLEAALQEKEEARLEEGSG